MQRIDSHQHFWQPARGDYRWLRCDVPALAPLCRDFMPDHFIAGVVGWVDLSRRDAVATLERVAVSAVLIGELSPLDQARVWHINAARFYALEAA